MGLPTPRVHELKHLIKIFCVLALGALICAGGIYFTALQIPGEPLLKNCWKTQLIEAASHTLVTGAEDMEFDAVTGTVFISAYNRRAVAREHELGRVFTQGGVYTLHIDDLVPSRALLVTTDITRSFKASGRDFRPHGIAIARSDKGVTLLAINRLYSLNDNRLVPAATLETFQLAGDSVVHDNTQNFADVCDPYDVALLPVSMGANFALTDVTRRCSKSWFATTGRVWTDHQNNGTRLVLLMNNLSFPNGIVATKDNLYIAETRSHTLLSVSPDGRHESVTLPVAPDNLTFNKDGKILFSGFPNLLDYYFYIQEWLGIKKSPSAAYRYNPSRHSFELLFKDDGDLLSGATVALQANNFLLLGAAWDDHIVVCTGAEQNS